MFKKSVSLLGMMAGALGGAAAAAASSAKSLAAALSQDDNMPFRNYGWAGLAPRKFRVAGPPAQYAEGLSGDIHRQRAIRRMDRWVKSRPGERPPRHIWNNFKMASGQEA